jgi:hypothetical protein
MRLITSIRKPAARAVRGGQAHRGAGTQDPEVSVAAPSSSPKYSPAPDDLPESAFYMVGTIEEALSKAQKMAAEAA